MARSALWSRLDRLEKRFPDLGPPITVIVHQVVGPGDPLPSTEALQRRDVLVKAAEERWRQTGVVQRVIWDPLEGERADPAEISNPDDSIHHPA